MAFTVEQLSKGRKPKDGDNASNEIPFLLISDSEEEEEAALIALRAKAPAAIGGLVKKDCTIDEPLQGAAAGWFYGSVSYVSPDKNKDTNESSFSFDTTGGQFKITQSKETVFAKCAAGVNAPDLNGAINVTDDSVEGTEITIPQYAFSETHYLPDSVVTNTYKGVLYALTGTVCNASFKGCNAGEALFLGARGQKRGRGDWEITFLFAASPNVTGLIIGAITDIVKKGWEYLWVRYIKKAIANGAGKKRVSQVPDAVYVERVYDPGAFSTLAIGTT
jgi:hypothetical protein